MKKKIILNKYVIVQQILSFWKKEMTAFFPVNSETDAFQGMAAIHNSKCGNFVSDGKSVRPSVSDGLTYCWRVSNDGSFEHCWTKCRRKWFFVHHLNRHLPICRKRNSTHGRSVSKNDGLAKCTDAPTSAQFRCAVCLYSTVEYSIGSKIIGRLTLGPGGPTLPADPGKPVAP